MKFFATLAALTVSTIAVNAAEVTWDGTYRAEAISVQNPALNNKARFDKSYILHHAVLQPKIVALDGLNLYGRIDIFNNSNYPATQMGDYLGGAPSTGNSQGAGGTAVNTQAQQTDTIQLSHFYLKWATEYGALFVGRTPLQFGLGITHNAGLGLFDHYFDTHDLVGYKFIAGNLFFMPMYGKVKEGGLSTEDDINDYIMHMQYDNPDTELSLGLFYDVRIATKTGNAGADGAAAGSPYGGAGATKTGSFETKTLNIFVARNIGNFRVGFESSFANGKTGVSDSSGREVSLDAYALAGELAWQPSGRWTFDMKLGLATGDDPGTTDKFEGYLFDRNYDLGWLMFNHKLGSYDVLGTGSFRSTPGAGQTDHDFSDTEYISNTFYLAPGAKYNLSESWNLNTRVVWAQVQRPQKVYDATGTVVIEDGEKTKNSLGIEWDLGVGYKPNNNLSLEAGAGFLFPGDAFKGGNANLPADFGYGLQVKTAVRF